MKTLSALSILLLAVSCKKAPQAAPTVEPKVILTKVTQKEIVNDNFFVGRVIADELVEIQARVTGELMKQFVKEGQQVKKGDKLFLIEQDDYKANLQQEKANLESAEANVKFTTTTLDRMQKAFKEDAVPKVEVDKAENDLAQSKASVSLAKAKITQAALELKWTEITAPVDGRIGVVSTSVGNILTPQSKSLVTITKDDYMEVEFTLNEKLLVMGLMKKMKNSKNGKAGKLDFSFINIELTLPEGSKYKHSGEVLFIDNRINPTTGSMKLRARFPNPNGLLVDGMYVKLRTYVDKVQAALIIPQACVLEDQIGKYVLLVNDQNVVEKRSIVVKKELGADFVLESGLKEGEAIILQGLQKVSPGKKVQTSLAQQEK